jgi:threonylcarbamoyladenosine tRNA methylthiotransferase MtaB
MPGLDPAPVRERAARLRAAGNAALEAELAGRVGGEGAVLIERPGIGRTEFYATAEVAGERPVGSIPHLRFIAAKGGRLVGAAAS